jgi:alpha-galactosidase
LVAAYKRVRPVVQHGAQHRLRGDGTLTGVEYARGDDHVVLAWCPTRSFGHAPAPLRRAGVRPDAVYRDLDTAATYPGAVLLQSGLPLRLPPGDYASSLVHLRRVG